MIPVACPRCGLMTLVRGTSHKVAPRCDRCRASLAQKRPEGYQDGRSAPQPEARNAARRAKLRRLWEAIHEAEFNETAAAASGEEEAPERG